MPEYLFSQTFKTSKASVKCGFLDCGVVFPNSVTLTSPKSPPGLVNSIRSLYILIVIGLESLYLL